MGWSSFWRVAPGLLLLLTASVVDARTTERRTTMVPKPRGTVLLRTVLLDAQNQSRTAVKVKPLKWDDSLAADARSYAAVLARERRFAHAPQPDGPTRQGENLWAGTRDAYSVREMVDAWTRERRFYRAAPTPNFSTTANWGDVAHYTQIVWHDATAVGCALASNKDDDILVCRYSPAGNVIGELAY